MDKEANAKISQQDAAEIEATGDAWVIADAIRAGFAELAGAIRECGRALAGDEDLPEEPKKYMDGRPMK